MLGVFLNLRRCLQQVCRGHFCQRDNVGDGGLSFGDRTGFIQNDRCQPMRILQMFGAPDQYAVFRAFAGSHHDGSRSGQSQSTGAGNNQNGCEIDQGPGEIARIEQEIPTEKGQYGQDYDSWDEIAGNDICKSLNRRFGALGFLDNTDDLGQSRIFADFCRGKSECAKLIERCAHYGITGFFVHGEAFPCQHGFIQG